MRTYVRLTLSDLSDAILLALIRRALADLRHEDSDLREEALKFIERLSNRVLFGKEAR